MYLCDPNSFAKIRSVALSANVHREVKSLHEVYNSHSWLSFADTFI